MKAILVAVALAAFVAPQEEARFATLDIFVDAGARALAAWQIEVEGPAEIVGVEGGEAVVWREAPQYDPEALAGGRLIVAAFTLEDAPPAGTIRVARLHVMETGKGEYTVRLMAAADVGGARFRPEVRLVRRGVEK